MKNYLKSIKWYLVLLLIVNVIFVLAATEELRLRREQTYVLERTKICVDLIKTEIEKFEENSRVSGQYFIKEPVYKYDSGTDSCIVAFSIADKLTNIHNSVIDLFTGEYLASVYNVGGTTDAQSWTLWENTYFHYFGYKPVSY
jgi:hypothetical protein